MAPGASGGGGGGGARRPPSGAGKGAAGGGGGKREELILEAKSPAEFFANNKTLTGFDNPTKALYTTVREFVENALDATETARVAPEIIVTMYGVVSALALLCGRRGPDARVARRGPITRHSEEFSLAEFQAMRGLGQLERVNPKLYLDYDDPKKVRVAPGRLARRRAKLTDRTASVVW